jgi:hypothetical protein
LLSYLYLVCCSYPSFHVLDVGGGGMSSRVLDVIRCPKLFNKIINKISQISQYQPKSNLPSTRGATLCCSGLRPVERSGFAWNKPHIVCRFADTRSGLRNTGQQPPTLQIFAIQTRIILQTLPRVR